MLTPIKKQGDEHIYILLQISIINWISVRYADILRFVWMLIGSEITYGDALSILYYCCPLKVSEQRDIHPQCCCNGIADDFSEGKPLS